MSSPATPRPKVLVISASPVGRVMSGPAIRAYEFTRALRPHADVTLAGIEARDDEDAGHADVVFRQQDPRPLRPHLEAADVVISQPPWPLVAQWARRSGARLIYDMYGPEPLEWLAYRAATAGEESRSAAALNSLWEKLTLDRVLGAFRDGHHFVCASEKQRDMWIGAMLGERVITEATYARDPSLRSVIDLAPFGLPSEPPRHSGSGGIRGRFPQISPDDEIVLWNGGIWSWLDALTVVRAMVPLLEKRPRARLVFISHSTELTGKIAQEEARDLAAELGLLDSRVFFNDTWVPYDERGDWLLEADCAASAHTDNLETRFAFRTRLLDCFWSKLPIVCTEGDELATRVEVDDLGRTVPPADPEAMAAALAEVLERGRDSYEPQLERMAEAHTWPVVTRNIVRFATAMEDPPGREVSLLSRPSRWARTTGFRAARSTLNAVGLDQWPRG